MDPLSGEDKKKKRGRPKANVEDLGTRLTKTNAGEDYEEVCIRNVFDRITFQSTGGIKPRIPDADIYLSLPSKLASNLASRDITQLLPTQRYTLTLLVEHDMDVFVGAATGHGKTLAFLIPIAVGLLRSLPRDISSCRRPLALIIANTQVLQVQTYRVCQDLVAGTGLRVVLVCGQTDMMDQKKDIEKGCDIVIATTGRLKQFLKEKQLSLEDLQYYVYDEADKMTQGGAFREDVTEIDTYIPPETKAKLRSCFFTATLDAMGGFEKMYREGKFCLVRVPGNPSITHKIIPIDMENDCDDKKSLILMQLLRRDLIIQGRDTYDTSKETYKHKTVIFVGLKLRCNWLGAYLRMYGFSVGVANGDHSLQMRNTIIKKFCDGEIQALIATDSMARGHDIPDVTHVINYDMADNALDTFKHRAGRTARIGHKGTCTTLLSRSDFLLFDDNPHISINELDPRRKRAKELAHYLVIECGQKIPKCLQKPALNAVKDELSLWGNNVDDPYNWMINEMGLEAHDIVKQEEMEKEKEKRKEMKKEKEENYSLSRPIPPSQQVEENEEKEDVEKKEEEEM
ncbi:hypothetical protein PENTCL1PPCAC_2330, partial [Pristionchus entomophagus]